MDAPASMQDPSGQSLPGRVWLALVDLELSSKLAMVCVAFGWFFMNTLAVSLGSLQHGVRFVDMSAVIADPPRLFFGGDTPVHRVLFSLLCLACLLGPVAPQFARTRAGWLGHVAPLGLMVACGALLYWRTSGEILAAPADTASLSGSLLQFANGVLHRGADAVSRHVSVGAGSYLAAIGCLVLAAQGLHRFAGTDVAR
jgi:hypothetical protein